MILILRCERSEQVVVGIVDWKNVREKQQYL